MDPRMLRQFLTICEEGSIAGAAKRLGLAQPSVSVAIRNFERRLGADLFVRGRRGIVLTGAGIALRSQAQQLENLLRDAAEAVALASRGSEGPLRIGGTPGALVTLIPAAIRRMEGVRPVSVTIIERSDEQLNNLLRDGDIELAAVTTGVEAPPEGMTDTNIARDPFALIVGRATDRLGPSVRLADVVGLKWVLPRAAGAFHRQIQALFLADEVPLPADVIRCDSLLTSKEIVRSSDRVTILPRGVVAPELSMGVLRAIPIDGAEMARRVGIRTMTGRNLSELGERFRTALTEAFQQ